MLKRGEIKMNNIIKIKNKVKLSLMILVLGVFMLLSGCSLTGSDSSSKTSGFLPSSGSTSTNNGNGVSLSFAENNPTSEMYKGNPTTFAFVFTNYQEHDISDLKVKIKGFETSFVQGLSNNYNVNTIPRYTSSSGAGVFSGLIVSGVSVDKFEGTYNFNPTFDYCYSAKTSFIEQVCVPSTTNTCDTDVSSSTTQNGPISVSIDRIVNSNDKVRVDFVLNDKGNGDVVNECFKTDDYANKYDLKVTLGSQTGSCEAVSGENIVNGKGNFYCEFSRSGDDSYASQIVVELDYKYQQSESKKIVVKDLNSQ